MRDTFLALAPGGSAASSEATIHSTSDEITHLVSEALEVADDARLEGRRSLIDHEAVVGATGSMRRIAHRLGAIALSRINEPGLSPWKYPSDRLVSAGKEGRHETSAVQRGADHQHPEGGGSRGEGDGAVPAPRDLDATFYTWRSKYGGLEVSEMRRLRQLEEENRRLKSIVAEQALDLRALKDVLAKNGYGSR